MENRSVERLRCSYFVRKQLSYTKTVNVITRSRPQASESMRSLAEQLPKTEEPGASKSDTLLQGVPAQEFLAEQTGDESLKDSLPSEVYPGSSPDE